MRSLWLNCSAVQGNRKGEKQGLKSGGGGLGTTGGLRARRAENKEEEELPTSRREEN